MPSTNVFYIFLFNVCVIYATVAKNKPNSLFLYAYTKYICYNNNSVDYFKFSFSQVDYTKVCSGT